MSKRFLSPNITHFEKPKIYNSNYFYHQKILPLITGIFLTQFKNKRYYPKSTKLRKPRDYYFCELGQKQPLYEKYPPKKTSEIDTAKVKSKKAADIKLPQKLNHYLYLVFRIE